MILTKIWKNSYHDSVSLMLLEQKAQTIPGIIKAGIVMGTELNREILKKAGLSSSDTESTGPNDLIIVLNCEDGINADEILDKIETWMNSSDNHDVNSFEYQPRSLYHSIKQHPDSNLVLISIPGRHAFREAMYALKKDKHVMLFSDNVSIEEEKQLKEFAFSKNLLVMGPDCGTAIINGIPLAFANKVNKGSIGIVGASGTGIQEVSSCIDNFGGGITHAIGTGGRDLKEDIGGLMMILGINALKNDPQTKVIVLISKPPAPSVEEKILKEVSKITKPVVIHFIGGNKEKVENSGCIWGNTLAETAHKAVCLEKGIPVTDYLTYNPIWNNEIKELKEKLSPKRKYMRGLFTGGTLCDEAMLYFQKKNITVYSNTPLKGMPALQTSSKSEKHTIIDLGDDEFTSGRAHPMIDPTLRIDRITKEAEDPETAVILLDIVLGYGSHESPGTILLPAITKAKEQYPDIIFVGSITGTKEDFQNFKLQKDELTKAGVKIFESNASACNYALCIIDEIENGG